MPKLYLIKIRRPVYGVDPQEYQELFQYFYDLERQIGITFDRGGEIRVCLRGEIEQLIEELKNPAPSTEIQVKKVSLETMKEVRKKIKQILEDQKKISQLHSNIKYLNRLIKINKTFLKKIVIQVFNL